MNAIISLLTSGWFAPFAGVVALLSLIWMAAPLLSQFGFTWLSNQTNQIILSLVLVLGYGGFLGVRFFLRRRKSKQLAQNLSGETLSDAQKATDAESAKLQEIFQRALEDLQKRLGSGKGKDYLYRLPWYVIIGPPGCGKTTALVNSGLKFPLSDQYGQHKIKGVAGTRYCDWWFSEEAILLDTAGRYSTQDSEQQVDRSAWERFLGLLKKYRPRRPINGVILAVSLSELLQSQPAMRTEMAVRLRQRLQELRKSLGIQFPVYLLFTKLDLVSGAMEFFDRLDKEDRRQVFGFTYPYEQVASNPDSVITTFDGEFDLLADSIDHRILDRLQEERDVQRRDQIYAFSRQFASLQPILKEFISEVFSFSRYEATLNLRGVYFSSGTQEGRPIDRIRARIAQLFDLSGGGSKPLQGQGKSFFLDHLFRLVMFPEAGMAGTDLRVERRTLWIRRGVFAGIGLLTILWMMGWLINYRFHQHYVEEVNSQLASLTQSAAQLHSDELDLKAAVELLEKARALPGAEQEPSIPFWRGMGLFQGEKLGRGGRVAYTKALEQVLLPRLLILLEGRLAAVTKQKKESIDLQATYLTLQTYQTLNRQEYGEHFDKAAITSWFEQEWAKDARLLPEERTALERNLHNLLEILTDIPFPPDDALIAEVRSAMPSSFEASQIQLQLDKPLSGVAGFNLNDISKRKMALVVGRVSGTPLTEGISSAYTAAGYPRILEAIDTRVKQLAEGDWVLNLPPLGAEENEELKRSLIKGYEQRYCAEWTNFLTDIRLLPPSDGLADAVDKLNLMTDADSPLRKLLEKVLAETKPVQQCFAALHDFAAGEAPTEMDRMFERLKGLTVLLLPLADLQHKVERIDSSVTNSIQAETGSLSANKPFPLNTWIGNFVGTIPTLLDQGISGQLNRKWKSVALPFCQRAIQGRYPVSPGSAMDINLADFKQFFARGGLLDHFLETDDINLSQYVDMSRSPWSWRAFDSKEHISRRSLQMLEAGRSITQNFFPQGAIPSAGFRVRLKATGGDLAGVVLDYHGTTALLREGDTAVILNWPPASPKPLRLEFYRQKEDPNPLKIVENGDWALFRLFDRGRVTRETADRYQVQLSFENFTAVLEVRADSVFNPLNATPERFACPSDL